MFIEVFILLSRPDTFNSRVDFSTDGWSRPDRIVTIRRGIRDFKIRDYRRLNARSPLSGGLDRVGSVVVCRDAKTQIKLLHYQLREILQQSNSL